MSSARAEPAAQNRTKEATGIGTDVKLSLAARFHFAFAEFGYNNIYFWISAFLMAYLIDTVRIPPAQVSLLILAVRIFDAANDPYIGSLADKTRSRWGRYRPWIGIGGVALVITVIAMFSMSSDWTMNGKMAYMWIVYILVTIASTCCNMPFGALNGCLTSNATERLKASSLRMVIAGIGIQVANVLAVPMLRFFSGGTDAYNTRGYFFAVLICGVISVPTLIWTAVKSREVVGPPPDQGKVSYRQMFKTMFSSRYVFVISLGMIANGINMYGGMTMGIYYFKFVANNPVLMGLSALVTMPFGWIGAGVVGPWLYIRMKNKGKVMALVSYIGAAAAIVRFFFPAPHPIWWIAGCLSALFMAGGALGYGMIGDAVDVCEYNTGVRCDGFLASFISTAFKIGGAIGPAFGALMLGMLHYNPDLVVQPANIVSGINALVNLIPAGFSLFIALIYTFAWDLSDEKHYQIRLELDRRRGQ
jgi:sugar (glycoside-pentoside-hexuronide) transporter